MSCLWLRLYTDLPDCRKLRLLPAETQLAYVWFLCLHKEGALVGADPGAIAWRLRMSEEDVERHVAALQAAHCLGEDLTPTGWEERQYTSDNSTERVRKHRLKQTCNATVKRFRNVTETPHARAPSLEQSRADTDTETETETERARDPGQLDEITNAATQILGQLVATPAWSYRDKGPGALAEVKRLVESRGTTKVTAEAAWYVAHAGEPFVPVLKGLRDLEKWGGIAEAMKRADNGKSPMELIAEARRQLEAAGNAK